MEHKNQILALKAKVMLQKIDKLRKCYYKDLIAKKLIL